MLPSPHYILFGPWTLWKTRFEQFRVEEDVSRVLDWMLHRLEFVTLTQASLLTGKCTSREHRHTGSRFGL